jgi:hypothetical protein
MPAGPVLYSTNVFLKFLIARKYLQDKHYVWCSEVFDSTKQGHYSGAAQVAASSDPCAIYKDLEGAIKRQGFDRHNAKVLDQKASLARLAVEWRDQGRISDDDSKEILYLANQAEPYYWRPIIYVIPRVLVSTRMKKVAPDRRASIGDEFIIEDLDPSEFDIIEM